MCDLAHEVSLGDPVVRILSVKSKLLGTVYSLFYNMAGAKCNGTITFFGARTQLGEHFLFSKYEYGLERASNFLWAQDTMNFYI